MNKQLAKAVCKLWNEKHKGYTAMTRTLAYVEAPSNPKHDECYDVIIKPDGINSGTSFHHIEELSDLKRAFGVSAFVFLDSDSGKLYGIIF